MIPASIRRRNDVETTSFRPVWRRFDVVSTSFRRHMTSYASWDEPFSQKMRIRDSDIRRFRATRSEIGFCLLSNFAMVLNICKILSLACRPFQWKYIEVSTIRIGLAILAENALAWQQNPPFSRNSWRNQSLLSNYTIDYRFYYLTKILST